MALSRKLKIIDKSNVKRPIVDALNGYQILIDSGATTCMWYDSINELDKYYTGKLALGEVRVASMIVYDVIVFSCNIPVGDMLFLNVPMMYSPEFESDDSDDFDFILGFACFQDVDIVVSIPLRRVSVSISDKCIKSGKIMIDTIDYVEDRLHSVSIKDFNMLYEYFKIDPLGTSIESLLCNVGLKNAMNALFSLL